MTDVGEAPPPEYQQPALVWMVEYTDHREPGMRFQLGAFTTEGAAQALLDKLTATAAYGPLQINMVPVHRTVDDWEWDR